MKCPICSLDLRMSDRQGIEIDYCTQCRGVWLDRGELDKIIERSMNDHRAPEMLHAPNPQPGAQQSSRDGYSGISHGNYSPSRYGQGGGGYVPPQKQHRKKSLLSELFDFD